MKQTTLPPETTPMLGRLNTLNAQSEKRANTNERAMITCWQVTEIVTDSSLTYGHQVVLVNGDSPDADIQLTLPAADVMKNRVLTIKNISANWRAIVDAAGSETIDGAASVTLTKQYAALTIISDGATWHVLAWFDGTIV